MTRSAPRSRNRSSFPDASTAVTSAPRALASCTAHTPTAPPTPFTSTRWPALTRPWSHRFISAMRAAVGTAAAPSNKRFSGMRASSASSTAANSAKVPALLHWFFDVNSPNTRSPGTNRVAPEPTWTSSPARSVPGTCGAGRTPPGGSPARRPQYPLRRPTVRPEPPADDEGARDQEQQHHHSARQSPGRVESAARRPEPAAGLPCQRPAPATDRPSRPSQSLRS